MENPEEILHSLEEFSKLKPKDIPRELEEYLCFVAKTGNPVYQWQTIKGLFREKLLNVITEFYESCPSVEIPPCPNVEMFNYDLMKNFILEKLDTFASAPFTVQRICELLTTPRKEYNRIDKYMRALEKNILVVSTTEPGRRSTENGESIMNGIEPEHLPESSNSSHDINVEEIDEAPSWPRTAQMGPILFDTTNSENQSAEIQSNLDHQTFHNTSDIKVDEIPSNTTITATKSLQENAQETVISCSGIEETHQPYVSIEPVVLNTCTASPDITNENQVETSLNITTLPAGVQQRRNSMETVEASEHKDAEVHEAKDTNEVSFSEIDKQKLHEEEQVQSLTDTLLPHPICSEHVEILTDRDSREGREVLTGIQVEKHSEENNLQKDESGTESTLENSSSLETLNVDANLEKYKNQLESNEKPYDIIQGEPQTALNEVSLKDEKWSEAKGESEQLTCALTSTFLEENEVDESILKTSDSSDHTSQSSSSSHLEISEPLSEAEVKSETCVANSSNDIPEHSDANGEVESNKLQTPMDIDVLSELKVDQKEEHLCEEPSSTSNTL